MKARLAVMSIRASPVALLQFKGESVCTHRLQARAAKVRDCSKARELTAPLGAEG